MNKTEMARTSAFVGKQVGKLDGMLGDSFSRIVPASNRNNLSNSSFVQGGREKVVEENGRQRSNQPAAFPARIWSLFSCYCASPLISSH